MIARWWHFVAMFLVTYGLSTLLDWTLSPEFCAIFALANVYCVNEDRKKK